MNEWRLAALRGGGHYPDAVREKEHFRRDLFLGTSYQSLPVEQSEKRLCEKRCLGVLDDMNNWVGAKYMIAEGDTYMKYPDDETGAFAAGHASRRVFREQRRGAAAQLGD